MAVKLFAFYFKRMFYAVMVCMYDEISAKLIMTTLFVVHGVFMIIECGLCKPVYKSILARMINVAMELQIQVQLFFLLLCNNLEDPNEIVGIVGIVCTLVPAIGFTFFGTIGTMCRL